MKKNDKVYNELFDKYIQQNAELNKLRSESNELKHENYRLGTRLDACLYAMCIMQSIIKNQNSKNDWIAVAE